MSAEAEALPKTVTCQQCGATVPVKAKKKREPTEYNKFFQAHMKTPVVQSLPHSERMGHVAKLWAAHKAKQKKA